MARIQLLHVSKMILESDESKIGIVGLRYGRKACICDIRYWLVIYELKIYLIRPTTMNLDGDSYRSLLLSSVTVNWMNKKMKSIKRTRIQLMVQNKEMDSQKSRR